MAPCKQYDHGFPYPLESIMTAAPAEPTREQPKLGLRKEILYIDHICKEEDPYSALAHINTLLLIGEMQKYWDEAGDIIRIIAPICTKYDRNRIDIEFMNNRPHGHFVTSQRR
ncbi:hypothetical protein F4680DRAFT_445494 [Xylaria scruposa]|nr:hypothetical protein F4680DRAFT_445494 [Xylaria scruposa]